MEGNCSTGQSLQLVVVPMEEEKEGGGEEEEEEELLRYVNFGAVAACL
jgi:hypothetical protein